MSPLSAGKGSRYAQRGVSSQKRDVHAVVDRLDSGCCPQAFCKVMEDCLTGDPAKCSILHSDGSGTKSLIAYLHYRETGDASVFRGIAQDSIVMNLDDLLCVGATGSILISNTVNRNARRFPAEALRELIEGGEVFLEKLRSLGIAIYGAGGETADVGDLTSTFVVDTSAVAVMPRAQLIDGSGIQPDLAIIGLASYGKASYETHENSGIGSNGLTSARHDLLAPYYCDAYPETFDPGIDPSLVYCGSYRLEDTLPGANVSIGEALLSPTRTYAPVIHTLLAEYRPSICGLVHCSGGGQTKCLRFGRNVHFVKDALLPLPPLFAELQKVGQTTWEELYAVYNMGHRMEIFCPPRDVDKVLGVIRHFGIVAQRIGYTESSQLASGGNHLTLYHGAQKLCYSHP